MTTHDRCPTCQTPWGHTAAYRRRRVLALFAVLAVVTAYAAALTWRFLR